MHDMRVMLAGKNIPGAAHVCSQLIDLVKSAIYDLATIILVPEIRDEEVIRLCLIEFRVFQIDPTDPETFALQAPHQMIADEATCTANQRCLHVRSPGCGRDRTLFRLASAVT